MNGRGTGYLVAMFLLGSSLQILLLAQGQVEITTTKLPAYLTGYNQVPPNQSSNVAVARLSYAPSPLDDYPIIFPPLGGGPVSTTYKVVTCEIFLPMNYEPLSAGIYEEVVGQNGNLMFPVGPFAVVTNVAVIIDNSQGTATYQTNVSFSCNQTLNFTVAQFIALKNQRCYVQVASAAYPQGELRGRIDARPTIGNFSRSTTGAISLDIAGPISTNYLVQTSTNLSNWTTVTNFATSSNFMRLNIPDTANDPARWFRVAY